LLDTAVTIHLSIPEVVLVTIVLVLAAIREFLHLVRVNAEELLEFLRWWISFKGQVHRIRQAGASLNSGGPNDDTAHESPGVHR
jgi:hypothetical protein